jgi:DnaJ-class molecular chaperone
VAPHPYYTRRGRDLYVKLPITLTEAAAGAKVDVPTPWGEVALRIPQGTSGGKKFRVKGHGVRTKNGEDGNLYAETQITLPPKLDEESLELIRQIESHQPTPNPRADLRW